MDNQPVISRLTQAKATLATAGYQFSNVGNRPAINGKPINRPVIQACLVGAGFSRCEAAKLVEELGAPMVNS